MYSWSKKQVGAETILGSLASNKKAVFESKHAVKETISSGE